jgi:hypothetical protein
MCGGAQRPYAHTTCQRRQRTHADIATGAPSSGQTASPLLRLLWPCPWRGALHVLVCSGRAMSCHMHAYRCMQAVRMYVTTHARSVRAAQGTRWLCCMRTRACARCPQQPRSERLSCCCRLLWQPHITHTRTACCAPHHCNAATQSCGPPHLPNDNPTVVHAHHLLQPAHASRHGFPQNKCQLARATARSSTRCARHALLRQPRANTHTHTHARAHPPRAAPTDTHARVARQSTPAGATGLPRTPARCNVTLHAAAAPAAPAAAALRSLAAASPALPALLASPRRALLLATGA